MAATNTASPAGASVILPVRNAGDTLAEQLDALVRQAGAPPFEVIVVLNRCIDHSASVATAFTDRLNLSVVSADAATGAAYARNVGVAHASAPVLLFCDGDDLADAGWVAGMVAAVVANPDSVVAGRLDVMRVGLPRWRYRWQFEAGDHMCSRVGEFGLPFAMTASMACSRSVFDLVGGFDDTFACIGGEDEEICARAVRAGLRVVDAPDAVMNYRPRADLKGMLAQRRHCRRGRAEILHREGLLTTAPSRLASTVLAVLKIPQLVLLRRRFHPMVIGVEVADYLIRVQTEREMLAAASRRRSA